MPDAHYQEYGICHDRSSSQALDNSFLDIHSKIIHSPEISGNLSGDSKEAHWNPQDFNLLMLQGCLQVFP